MDDNPFWETNVKGYARRMALNFTNVKESPISLIDVILIPQHCAFCATLPCQPSNYTHF